MKISILFLISLSLSLFAETTQIVRDRFAFPSYENHLGGVYNRTQGRYEWDSGTAAPLSPLAKRQADERRSANAEADRLRRTNGVALSAASQHGITISNLGHDELTEPQRWGYLPLSLSWRLWGGAKRGHQATFPYNRWACELWIGSHSLSYRDATPPALAATPISYLTEYSRRNFDGSYSGGYFGALARNSNMRVLNVASRENGHKTDIDFEMTNQNVRGAVRGHFTCEKNGPWGYNGSVSPMTVGDLREVLGHGSRSGIFDVDTNIPNSLIYPE